MLFTIRNIKNVTILSITMALTIFFFRGFLSEVELNLINTFPFLFSAFCGASLAFLYLYLFKSQRKDSFFRFLIPGFVLLVALIVTGLANTWIIDDLVFMLVFVFSGHEISKSPEKSL